VTTDYDLTDRELVISASDDGFGPLTTTSTNRTTSPSLRNRSKGLARIEGDWPS